MLRNSPATDRDTWSRTCGLLILGFVCYALPWRVFAALPVPVDNTPALQIQGSNTIGAKLGPALAEGNYKKTMAAPVTVIIGRDEDFHEKLPYLFPHADAKSWFDGPREGREKPSLRNSSLQAAYLIVAARALGLDAGPMTGFDNGKVDEAFFAGTNIKSDILVNLGQGDPASIYPRSPRLSFDEAARIE